MVNVPQLKCYLVDDDQRILDFLAKSLEPIWDSEMVKMESFFNPRTALQRINDDPCDVLFTDIEMPEISGVDLIKAGRARNPWMQVIVISAHSSLGLLHSTIEAGASDYLIKPLSADSVERSFRAAAHRVDQWRSVLTTAVGKVWNAK